MHRHSILLLALLATLPGVHSFGSLQYLRPGGTQVPGPYTAYAMTHGNNGQEWELPTYTDAKGNQFQFTNGQFGREWMGPYMQAEAMNSLADNLNLPSNRAMKKPEQRLYNGGVHWVSG